MVDALLADLSVSLQVLDENILMQVLAEVVATQGDLRARVNPKYRFDERLHDLMQCLLLDGYLVRDKRLLQTAPSIADAMPINDDLIEPLLNSGGLVGRTSSPGSPPQPNHSVRHHPITTRR
ncbi:hypothetical protein [Paraburkholderia unamae]|uniref:Uncharacterized protein n=1 Tax=Paraburkholderia unamae TaxID=219649 RepID=A0ABX5KM38_9BURK|nr:hypothetical protein [Paraburkholderia unamae]PVX83209.1 hypothetical protein C7402_107115 [Paraburkholderia unamae]